MQIHPKRRIPEKLGKKFEAAAGNPESAGNPGRKVTMNPMN